MILAPEPGAPNPVSGIHGSGAGIASRHAPGDNPAQSQVGRPAPHQDVRIANAAQRNTDAIEGSVETKHRATSTIEIGAPLQATQNDPGAIVEEDGGA